MAQVFWEDNTREFFLSLPSQVQDAITQRLTYLQDHPEMYQVVEQGRHAGRHRIPIRPHYAVYYRVFGDDRNVFVVAVVDARMR